MRSHRSLRWRASFRCCSFPVVAGEIELVSALDLFSRIMSLLNCGRTLLFLMLMSLAAVRIDLWIFLLSVLFEEFSS